MTHILKNKKQSSEHIKKRVAARWKNGTYAGWHWSDEQKKLRSEVAKRLGYGKWMFGKEVQKSVRKKRRKEMIARWKDPEYKKRVGQKISLSKKGIPHFNQRGENHSQWKGGVDYENNKIRHSIEYRLWRESVFARDNFTCQFCGKRGGQIEADHIKPFSLYPELRLAIDNGRTLCKECHKTTDTYLGKARRKSLRVI